MVTQDLSDLRDPDHAAAYLGEKLREGTLVLILGAGVTTGFGLPQWLEFVNRIRAKVGLDPLPDDATADVLQQGADDARGRFDTRQSYRAALRDALYEDVALSPEALAAPLMNAIGALLMGSKRGKVQRVITFNFDSMLEWFLSMHGFVVRVIKEVPSLEGDEDVRIYHPHGFLPHPRLDLEESSNVVLGLDSVHERLGAANDPWFETTRYLLRTGVALVVGMSANSFRDPVIGSLLMATGREVASQRPTGVWLLYGGASAEEYQLFERRNVVALPRANEQEVRDFLLSICRRAARNSIIT